jgi:hypothetical protein
MGAAILLARSWLFERSHEARDSVWTFSRQSRGDYGGQLDRRRVISGRGVLVCVLSAAGGGALIGVRALSVLWQLICIRRFNSIFRENDVDYEPECFYVSFDNVIYEVCPFNGKAVSYGADTPVLTLTASPDKRWVCAAGSLKLTYFDTRAVEFNGRASHIYHEAGAVECVPEGYVTTTLRLRFTQTGYV